MEEDLKADIKQVSRLLKNVFSVAVLQINLQKRVKIYSFYLKTFYLPFLFYISLFVKNNGGDHFAVG